ncbi:polysaccharide deacetylase family protein [Lysinibacillus fusiformis]|jgi:peptidoglycan/xylan/chitin deacetylase (PgdA/CDA1 family)|uniref:polysaccharide deacetylase family protein n=1 Tax=Lysinibacillus fusiformis TaxID=28031 RepID=UPI0019675E22|nr:polysaccharide deacetylase family protein [Lysinibacillus fusiformis]QSB11936.1 polysaccharide deacetylase family protein [Lysinibacillus fusiformis]
MSNYKTNIIELHSIRSDSILFLLNVKTILNKKTVFLELEIDSETYDQFKKLVIFDNYSRYRLSLRSKWDPFRNEFLSTITKSNGSIIESYDFKCSEQYVEILNQLNTIQSAKKLSIDQKYKFITICSEVDKKRTKQKRDSQKIPKKRIKHLIQMVIGVVVILVTFFIAFNNIMINVNIFPETTENEKVVKISSEKNMNSVAANTNKGDEVSKTDVVLNEEPIKKVNAEDYFITESEMTYSLPEGYAAITFDDGPSKYTKEIVDILVDHDIKATFFFIGQNAVNYPQYVTYAKQQQMSIGSHSWEHKELSEVSSSEQITDLNKTNEVLSSIIGEPVTLLRPPYGAFNEQLKQNARNQNMKMVMWNRDPEDWRVEDSEEIIEYIRENGKSGSIYLFHETSKTVEVLPKILEYLKQHDIKLVVLQ